MLYIICSIPYFNYNYLNYNGVVGNITYIAKHSNIIEDEHNDDIHCKGNNCAHYELQKV